MTLIIILLLSFILAKSKNWQIQQVSILLMVFLFGLRSYGIPDVENYIEMYRDTLDYDDGIEYGFLLLCHFFKTIGFEFHGFLLLITFLMFESWWYLTRKITDSNIIFFPFIIFCSYWGVYYYGIVLRSAIAITLMFWGIFFLYSYKKKLGITLFSLFLFLSITIQIGSLLFLLVFLFRREIKAFYLYITVALSSLLLITGAFSSIGQYVVAISSFMGSQRFGHYVENMDGSDGASIRAWSYIVFAIMFICLRKYLNENERLREWYNLFLNMFILALVINSALWEIPVASRLPSQFLFFDYFLFYFVVCKSKSVHIRKASGPILLIVTMIKLFSLIHYFPDVLNF